MRLGISWGSDSMPGGNGRARSTSRNTCSIPRRWWHAGGAAIRSRESRKAERLAERLPGPRSYSHYWLSANSLANTGTVSSYRKLPTVCKKYERKSEGAQEIEKVLFVTLAETIKLPDHSIGFRLDAAMLLDSHKQVAGASIVQEEKTLSKAPQGRGAELVSYRLALRYPILKVLAHLVKRQIRIEVCRLSGQGGNAGVRIGCKCRSVAKMAGDLSKKRFTFQDGCGAARHCIGRLRRGQKAHEGGEVFDVAEHVERRVRCADLIGIRIGAIVGHFNGGVWTCLFPLRLEQLVGNAHLHVVGFAGKDEQGFVLSFPAKSGDGSVVTVVVGFALDSTLLGLCVAGNDYVQFASYLHTQLRRRFLREVRQNIGIANLLDQSGAEHRGRDPKDYIFLVCLKVRLRQLATDSACRAHNGE